MSAGKRGGRNIHVPLDQSDVHESEIGAMVRGLPRNMLKLWVLKIIKQRLGTGDAASMSERLKEDLLGNLEDTHVRHQRQNNRVDRPVTSEPLTTPPQSEPIGRKKPPDDDPLKKAGETKKKTKAAGDQSLYM